LDCKNYPIKICDLTCDEDCCSPLVSSHVDLLGFFPKSLWKYKRFERSSPQQTQRNCSFVQLSCSCLFWLQNRNSSRQMSRCMCSCRLCKSKKFLISSDRRRSSRFLHLPTSPPKLAKIKRSPFNLPHSWSKKLFHWGTFTSL
jgi:hypothetical protein